MYHQQLHQVILRLATVSLLFFFASRSIILVLALQIVVWSNHIYFISYTRTFERWTCLRLVTDLHIPSECKIGPHNTHSPHKVPISYYRRQVTAFTLLIHRHWNKFGHSKCVVCITELSWINRLEDWRIHPLQSSAVENVLGMEVTTSNSSTFSCTKVKLKRWSVQQVLGMLS